MFVLLQGVLWSCGIFIHLIVRAAYGIVCGTVTLFCKSIYYSLNEWGIPPLEYLVTNIQTTLVESRYYITWVGLWFLHKWEAE